MKLAVNYSPKASELVRSGEIQIDLFKCFDDPRVVAKAQGELACYVHFSLYAGRNEMGQVDWDQLKALLESTVTPYVNMHLGPRASDFGEMPLDTREPEHRAELIDAMRRDIDVVLKRFEPERVILENVMWDPEPEWLIPQPVLEPEVIGQVVTESGCGFILDLAHADISARHFGVDTKEYVCALPMDRLCELHVTGVRMDENGLWKDHHPLEGQDWELLEWAMERIRSGEWPEPWVVTFEYGGVGPDYETRTDRNILAEQVPRLLGHAKCASSAE
jgi:uncharacterized protein (UPF0276 family)